MKKIIVIISLPIVLVSCSIGKKMTRVAHQTMLDNAAFTAAHTGIVIFDPLQNRFLYDYQANKYFVPASNTKLFTCYAAMKYLGDSLPGVKYQVLDDSTVLVTGTGDPTILHPDFPRQPVVDFLSKFREIQVSTSGFKEYLGNGWSWNDYTEPYMAPRSALPLYGNVARFKLDNQTVAVVPAFFANKTDVSGGISPGLSVNRPWNSNEFQVTGGRRATVEVPFVPYDSTIAHLLADTLHIRVTENRTPINTHNYVYTQPLDTMLSVMMHRSDNFFAEQSLLMVSNKLLGEMDDRKIISKLLQTDLISMPQTPSWVDGSGLSRYNLVSPKDFVQLLTMMKDTFGLDRLKAILPTGGTGTLSSLYLDDEGYIFAKTGTLNGVVALSGYLITRKNRLLIFSVLVNNHRSSAAEIRKGIERFLKEIRSKY